MMNTTFILELYSDFNIPDKLKILIQKIVGSIYCDQSKIIASDHNTFIKIEDTEIVFEIYSVKENQNKYIINMLGHNDVQKINLLKNLGSDKSVKQLHIIYDALSNIKLISSYNKLNLFENTLRFLFLGTLIDYWNSDVFELLEELNTKEDIRHDKKLNSNINTKVQKYELSKLIEHIKSHPLGGKETKVYNQIYETIQSKEQVSDEDYQELKHIVNIDLFKDISDKLVDETKIKQYRNAICHNRCVDNSKFSSYEEYVESTYQNIKPMCDKIEKVLKVKLKPISDEVKGSIIFAIKSENEEIDNGKLKLYFNRILNVCDYIYSDITEFEDMCIQYNKLDSEGIAIELSYLKNDKNEQYGIFVLHILYRTDLEATVFKIDTMHNKLLNYFENRKIIYLVDDRAKFFSNNLFAKFNYIENILRSYIALFDFNTPLSLKSKEATNVDELFLKNLSKDKEINTNIFFSFDFIDLMDILTRPIGGNVNKIREKLKKALAQNGNRDDINIIIRDISSFNDSLKEIIRVWPDLYKYRTILAHNGLLFEHEYKEAINICADIRKNLEDIYFDYLNEIASCSSDNDNKIIDNVLEVRQRNGKTSLRLSTLNRRVLFEFKGFIRVLRFVNALNSINSNFKANFYDYYVLDFSSLKSFLDKNSESIVNTLADPNIEDSLSQITDYLEYSNYLTDIIIDSDKALLENEINDLLKKVEEEFGCSE